MESKLIVARNFLMKEILKMTKTHPKRCFQKIYCDRENFVVTDGNILLFSPSENKEKGYYEMAAAGKKKVTFNPISWNVDFPVWRQAIPDCEKSVYDFPFPAGTSSESTTACYQLQFLLSTICDEERLLANKYLTLILATNIPYHVYISKQGVVTFKAKGLFEEVFTVVVMPLITHDITKFTHKYKDQLLKKWKADKNNGI